MTFLLLAQDWDSDSEELAGFPFFPLRRITTLPGGRLLRTQP